jgi:hypothetical protein
MPKSTAVSRAGAAANRFPSCRSAWKTPWSSAWARKPRVRLFASSARSSPGSARVAGSESAAPSAQVSASTRLPTTSQTTSGACM